MVFAEWWVLCRCCALGNSGLLKPETDQALGTISLPPCGYRCMLVVSWKLHLRAHLVNGPLVRQISRWQTPVDHLLPPFSKRWADLRLPVRLGVVSLLPFLLLVVFQWFMSSPLNNYFLQYFVMDHAYVHISFPPVGPRHQWSTLPLPRNAVIFFPGTLKRKVRRGKVWLEK